MTEIILHKKTRSQIRRDQRNTKKMLQNQKSTSYHQRIQRHLDRRDFKKYNVEDLDEFSPLQDFEDSIQDSLTEVSKLIHDLSPQLKDIESSSLSNYQYYIYNARFSKGWKQIEWDGWKLPAQGIEYDICDAWIFYGCSNIEYHPKNQHYSEHIQYKCKRSSCPLCIESWVNRQAARTTRRLSEYTSKQPYKFRHIILSPPPNEVNGINYDYPKLKKYLEFALKVANIKTASIV